jgi:hypothetical protein
MHCGVRRTHGELLKLGVEVAQATVAKYMVRSRPPPGQNWKTFLHNTPLGPLRWIYSLCRRSVSGSFMRSWSCTMIAGASSQWRSHPIRRPNGLRGRSPKPSPRGLDLMHRSRHRARRRRSAQNSQTRRGLPQPPTNSRPLDKDAPTITSGRSWQSNARGPPSPLRFGPSFR